MFAAVGFRRVRLPDQLNRLIMGTVDWDRSRPC